MFCLACALSCAPALAGPTPQTSGGMLALPDLGGAHTRASAVSADGDIVVGWGQVAGNLTTRLCVWSQGTLTAIPGPGGAAVERALVSADGLVCAGVYLTANSIPSFLWSATAGYTLLDVPGSHTVTVTGLSADGNVAVGQFWTPGGFRAFRWTATTGVVDLGTLGGPGSAALAVSADGSIVVGTSQNLAGSWQPFRWTAATGMQALPVGSGPGGFTPRAMSADGSVLVGEVWNGGLQYRAFRWTAPGNLQNLGTLGGTWARANGVNAAGTVVVGTSQRAGGGQRAFRWTSANGMQDLGALSEPWSEAYAVSDNGDVVVGMAGTSASTIAAFRWERGVDVPLGAPGCAAVPNSTGAAATLTASGSNLPAANRVILAARGLPPQALGYFLVAPNAGFTASVPGSQGHLCLAGPIGRYVGPGQVQSADAQGALSLAIDLAALPQPTGPSAYIAGMTWHFQTWYRDANPTSTSNFSTSLGLRLY